MSGGLGTIDEQVAPSLSTILLTSPRSALSDTHFSSSSSLASSPARPSPQPVDDEEDDDEFVYPTSVDQNPEETVTVPPPQHPSPAQLESLYAAASSGDLPLLKRLFRNALDGGNVEPFSLSNDASVRTGFTALHAAASRGYLDIVTWCTFRSLRFARLSRSVVLKWSRTAVPCRTSKTRRARFVSTVVVSAAFIDLHWQTALHKAALNGHLHIIKYLLPSKADVNARDADGWTALHNACSKVTPLL